MAKAATQDALSELHALVAQSLSNRIRLDLNDEVPTDAATLGAAIKFLKDNNISADPADSDDLKELRDNLAKRAEARRSRRDNVVSLATGDMKVMEG